MLSQKELPEGSPQRLTHPKAAEKPLTVGQNLYATHSNNSIAVYRTCRG